MLDFDAYYRLISDIKKGINPYSVDYMRTLGPPLVFVYYFPFSFLNLEISRSVFNIINISSLFISIHMLISKYVKKHYLTGFLAVTTIILSSFPIRFAIYQGQPIMVIALIITLLLLSNDEKEKGLLLSLITLIKTNYVLSSISFIKKMKRAFLVNVLLLSLFIVVSFAFIDIRYYLQYSQKIILDLTTSFSNVSYYDQSLKATMVRFGTYNKYLYFLIIGYIVYYLFKSAKFINGIIVSVILSPVAWQHYFAAFFPIFIYLFVKLKKRYILLFSVAFILWWIEIPYFHQPSNSLIFNLFESHYFFSGILLLIFDNRIKI
jgi:hypothetical protein